MALWNALTLGATGTMQPKNILFIGTDQQRLSTLNCYGHDFAVSPNIDRLALEGVRFTDAYTASPVCSPSRTSTLLGVHVPIHGIYENGISPHDHIASLTSWFDVIKGQGYSTAMIGKTHFDPVPSTIDHLDVHTGNADKRGSQIAASEFLETYLVNQTMEWITNVSTTNGSASASASAPSVSKPWGVYVSFVSPHPPNWVPKGPWSEAYEGVTLPPINYKEGNIGELPYQTRMLLGLLGKEHDDPPAFPMGVPNMSYIDQSFDAGAAVQTGRLAYYTQAAYVDHEVGRILDFLDTMKLRHSTLVIFASDHGSELWDHGIGNDKHTFLDAALRVPLILRLPGILPPNATRRFASLLDVTATIIAASGIAPHKGPADHQGFDLIAPIAAGGLSPRRAVVSCEYRAMALITPTWKLSYFPEQGDGQLFDRRTDWAEQIDLYNKTSMRATRDGLLIALLRWRAQQDALGYMQAHSKGAGPTATLAFNHTESIRGIDAEVRLQEDALQYEP